MRWLQETMTKQTGFIKFNAIVFTVAVGLFSLVVSNHTSSFSAQAQTADCTPSLHRLLLGGQQIAVVPSLIDEFTNDTPITETTSTQRIDQIVIDEGFASIPLNPRQANGERNPKLKSVGIVYRDYYWWSVAKYSVWQVRNRSSQATSVTLKSKRWSFDWRRWRWALVDGRFSTTVTIAPYSDGFIRSNETSRFSLHQLIDAGAVRGTKRTSYRKYRDSRTIDSGTSTPLFQAVLEQGVVNLENAALSGGLALTAEGRLATADGIGFYSVWKISNGTDQAQTVTLDAVDSDYSQTITVPSKTDTYVRSDEDGCLDNPLTDQEALWVAESEGLLKVLTENGQVAFELVINEPISALSVSSIDRTIWVLTNGNTLEGFDAQGVAVATNTFALNTPVERMAVGTNNAWLVSGNTLQIISREDSTQAIVDVVFAEAIQNVIYDSLQDRIWVILSNTAIAIDANGAQQNEVDPQLGSIVATAYDKRLDNLWLVGTRNATNWVARYNSQGDLQTEFDTGANNAWSNASADSNGGLWLANAVDIAHAAKNAELEFSVPAFADIADTNIVDIAAGSKDGSLWVANQTLLRQYNVAGALLKTLTPELGDGLIRNLNHIDLEIELPATLPSLSILSPEEGAVLTESPAIRIAVSPSISTADVSSLLITDGGAPIASTCQATGNELSCAFSTLADGDHEIGVSVNDVEGVASDTATVSFTIDSIAPVITIDSPVEGSTVTVATITVAGAVSEAADVTVQTRAVALDSSNQFSIELTLNEGFNNIFVNATDAAGNRTIEAVMVIFNANQPPEITSQAVVTAKAENDYFYDVDADDSNNDELVYSLVNAPSGMTIDSATGEINWLPSVPGTADVTVSVTDQRGGTDQQQFTITIAPANLAPSITSLAPTETAVDANYLYNVIASDPDGDTLSFRLLDAPNGLRINSESGQVTWAPYFAGSSRVVIEVRDPRGLSAVQEYTVNVAYTDGQQPPALAAIGDITAPLGQTATRIIAANDLEGKPLSFSIAPLPLPEGMRFHEKTGEFKYRPVESSIGTKAFTFSASNGRFSSVETVNITVPQPDGITRLRGRTLLPDGTPIQGVRFEMGGQESTSDANGDFLIENIPGPSGRKRFIVDGSGVDPSQGTFASIPEQFNMVAGADNELFAPVYLMPLDIASADKVDPFQETVISSSDVIIDGVNYGPVEITIDPRTANIDATGELYDDIISISRIPDVEFGPAPMPEDLGLSVYIAVQPFGVNYTEPARVSFPNVESFPPATLVDIFGLNHDTGAFEKTGEAEVSADGKRVNSIGGAIFNNSWHGFVPRSPSPNPPPPDCDCDKSGDAASSYGTKTGNFNDYHSTVPYYSLGAARNLRFTYNSKWANPSPILNFDTAAGLPPPLAMSQKLLVSGIETQEVFIQPGSLGDALTGLTRNAIQFNARPFFSGIYPYEFVVDCFFPISRRAGRAKEDIVIINRSNSPYGAGWGIDGLRRLLIKSDRKRVAMDLGNDNYWMFTKREDGSFQRPAGHFSDLTENTDSSYTLITKSGIRYEFSPDGLLTEMADRNSNTTAFVYDSDSRLIRATDPLGLKTELSYIGALLSAVTDAAGRITRFDHDSEGNLIKITDPDDTYRTFEYEQNTNLMISKTDKRRFSSVIKYDQFGRFQSATLPDNSVRQARPQDTAGLPDLKENAGTMQDLAPQQPNVSEVDSGYSDANGNAESLLLSRGGFIMERTDSVGRTSEYVRDAVQNITKKTRPNGSVITRTFDNNGNVLTQREDFNGATSSYTYDSFSLVTSTTDALNRVTRVNRDSRGNMTRIENAQGHIGTHLYDNRGLVTRMTDPNGLVTTYSYNEVGLAIRILETPPTGEERVTAIQYTQFGLPLLISTPDGITQTIQYDELNRPVRLENQLGEVQVTTYDEYGNEVASQTLNIDGSIATQETRKYDERNRLIEISTPHESGTRSVTKQEYDGNSNLIKITDPDGKVTKYFYDGEDRLIQIIHADGGSEFYQYDESDQIVSVQAANGAITTYEYDILKRKLVENSPDRGQWQWQYNIVNVLTEQTDDRGITTNITYDLIDRQITKTYPNANENVTYRYDSCEGGVGRLCARSDESGGHSYSYDFFGNMLSKQRSELGVQYIQSYLYDDGDHVIQSTYPTGRVVNFERDGIRRLSSLSTNGTPIINNMTYRGDSEMISRDWTNGIQEIRDYDQQARIKQIALGTIGNRDYRYDASSNITSNNSSFQTGQYSYDQNDRIISESLSDIQQITFSYDFNGNRLSKLINAGQIVEQYNYLQSSNKLLSTDKVSSSGAITSVVNRDFAHNDVNRIRSVVINNEVVGTYFYNDLGLRSRKELIQNDGSVEITVYHYDIHGGVIAETSATGTVQREYIWNGREPVAQFSSAGVTYLHSDHLYTPRLGTDDLQAITWQWESDAFGAASPQVEVAQVNLRFPGQYFDSESGLYYNWNRYYDAEIGRYVTSDPIGMQGGANTYGYVSQQPNRYYDIEGLKITGSWNPSPHISDISFSIGVPQISDDYKNIKVSGSGAAAVVFGLTCTDDCTGETWNLGPLKLSLSASGSAEIPIAIVACGAIVGIGKSRVPKSAKGRYGLLIWACRAGLFIKGKEAASIIKSFIEHDIYGKGKKIMSKLYQDGPTKLCGG